MKGKGRKRSSEINALPAGDAAAPSDGAAAAPSEAPVAAPAEAAPAVAEADGLTALAGASSALAIGADSASEQRSTA